MIDLAHAGAFHEDHRGGDAFAQHHRIRIQFQHLAVFDHGDIALGDAHLLRQQRVLEQVANFAVHGNHELGTRQMDEQLHLFLAGVTRDVHRGNRLVDHVRAALEQAVDGTVHTLLVAGDGVRGQHDGIAADHVEQAVGAGREPSENGGRLTLRAGAHNHHVLGGHGQGLLDAHLQLIGDFQIAQTDGDLEVVLHGGAHEGQFAPVALGHHGHLLHPRNERGEGGDNDAAFGLFENLLQADFYPPFGGRPTGAVGVGGIG